MKLKMMMSSACGEGNPRSRFVKGSIEDQVGSVLADQIIVELQVKQSRRGTKNDG